MRASATPVVLAAKAEPARLDGSTFPRAGSRSASAPAAVDVIDRAAPAAAAPRAASDPRDAHRIVRFGRDVLGLPQDRLNAMRATIDRLMAVAFELDAPILHRPFVMIGHRGREAQGFIDAACSMCLRLCVVAPEVTAAEREVLESRGVTVVTQPPPLEEPAVIVACERSAIDAKLLTGLRHPTMIVCADESVETQAAAAWARDADGRLRCHHVGGSLREPIVAAVRDGVALTIVGASALHAALQTTTVSASTPVAGGTLPTAPSPADLQSDLEWLVACRQALRAFSLDEVRRLIVARGHGRFSADYVESLREAARRAASSPDRSRSLRARAQAALSARLVAKVDGLGQRANLVLAAQLGKLMHGAPRGTTYATLIADFKACNPALRGYVRAAGAEHFGVLELEALQAAYPDLVPVWPSGCKAEPPDLQRLLAERAADPRGAAARLLGLARIPIWSHHFDRYSGQRAAGEFKGARFVYVGNGNTDTHVLFRWLVLHGGFAGRDISHVVKHYGADPWVTEANLYANGLRVAVTKDGADLCATAENLLQREIEEASVVTPPATTWLQRVAPAMDLGPRATQLYVHVEGLPQLYDVMRRAQRPGVSLNVVSHTTSDARALLDDPHCAGAASVSVMATCADKLELEATMFPLSFAHHLQSMQRAIVPDIYEREHLVMGLGNVGRSLCAAARVLGLDLAVYDPQISASDAKVLTDAGVRVAADLAASSARKRHVAGAVGKLAFTREDFAVTDRDTAISCWSTGQLDFDMPGLAAMSTQRSRAGDLGHMTSYRYTLPSGADVTAVHDANVANFACGQPNVTAYSMLLNVLVAETLHDATENRRARERRRGRLPPQLPGAPLRTFVPRGPVAVIPSGRPAQRGPRENPWLRHLAPGARWSTWEDDVPAAW